MRYSSDEMVLADDRILEYARENDRARATEMAENKVRYSASYLSQRIQKLVKWGLLQNWGGGVYVITEKGEAYLDGEYDVQTGEWLEREDKVESAETEVTQEGSS